MSARGRCEVGLRRLALAASVSCGSPARQTSSVAPPAYTALSQTGFHTSADGLAVPGQARAFAPAFALWSDGAEKSRWIALPDGERIDTRDMDHWLFPVGTRAWKEFALAGMRLETRLIERWGPGPNDYFMGTFVWNAEQTEAYLAADGSDDVLGTAHDAPAQERCPTCHNGDTGRILGFSALQLAATSLTAPPASSPSTSLSALADDGWLDTLPPSSLPIARADPGTMAPALGYLHANCGHCHNPRGTAWPDTQMLLRVDVDEPLDERSGIYESVVGQRLQYFRDQGGQVALRVDPGRADSSGLIARMAVRGPREQMPPLATEQIDVEGLELIRSWIEAMPAASAP